MKKIFVLISLLFFVLSTACFAQTTDNNQSKSNKFKVTRCNTVNYNYNGDQTKTTTAPEKQGKVDGTKSYSNDNQQSENQDNNQTVVNKKQCEKREVTVQNKKNIVVPKK